MLRLRYIIKQVINEFDYALDRWIIKFCHL